jgi:hypothetical protein
MLNRYETRSKWGPPRMPTSGTAAGHGRRPSADRDGVEVAGDRESVLCDFERRSVLPGRSEHSDRRKRQGHTRSCSLDDRSHRCFGFSPEAPTRFPGLRTVRCYGAGRAAAWSCVGVVPVAVGRMVWRSRAVARRSAAGRVRSSAGVKES